MATWPGTQNRNQAAHVQAGRGRRMNTAAAHVPVMPDRVRAILAPALGGPGAVLVDATLGRAGHTRALLADHPGLTVIGIDADETAIEESRRLLAADMNRVQLVQATYDQLAAILADVGRDSVQGV